MHGWPVVNIDSNALEEEFQNPARRVGPPQGLGLIVEEGLAPRRG